MRDAQQPRETAISALESALREVFAKAGPGIVSAYVFGSQADGRAHRESDVDVAVLLDRAAHPLPQERFEARLGLTGAVARALRRNDVDLIVLNDAPAPLAARVVTGGRRVFCASPEADHVFRRDVQLRAADLLPFLRRTRRLVLEAVRR